MLSNVQIFFHNFLSGGDLTSSLQSYLQSLDVLRSSGCGDESIEVALVLGAIGQLHMKRRCYAEAIVTLQHCMRIFDSNGKLCTSTLIDYVEL